MRAGGSGGVGHSPVITSGGAGRQPNCSIYGASAAGRREWAGPRRRGGGSGAVVARRLEGLVHGGRLQVVGVGGEVRPLQVLVERGGDDGLRARVGREVLGHGGLVGQPPAQVAPEQAAAEAVTPAVGPAV